MEKGELKSRFIRATYGEVGPKIKKGGIEGKAAKFLSDRIESPIYKNPVGEIEKEMRLCLRTGASATTTLMTGGTEKTSSKRKT